MINWDISSVSITNVRNKDKVLVTCEKCGSSREQLYIVAKKKSEHICMSCVKSKSKYKPILSYYYEL